MNIYVENFRVEDREKESGSGSTEWSAADSSREGSKVSSSEGMEGIVYLKEYCTAYRKEDGSESENNFENK